MSSLEWQDKFSVNVAEMDRHHQKLLSYFNELQNEIMTGESAKIEETLNKLIDYSSFHFSDEERLMRAMSYPGLTAQIQQHAYFTDEVYEMKRQLKLGTLPSRSVLSFLKDWFINHVMAEDRKYGKLMTEGKPLV